MTPLRTVAFCTTLSQLQSELPLVLLKVAIALKKKVLVFMGRTRDVLDIFRRRGSVHGFYARGSVAMLSFRLVLSSEQREALLSHLKAAERRGDLPAAKRFLAILALGENRPIREAAGLLNLTAERL